MSNLLAVSGGVDSMVMWHMLHSCGLKYEVAHVNYNYRHDSKLDQELVQSTASSLGVVCHVLSLEKYTLNGFEEWARNMRYKWFKTLNSDVLYTAHHAGDQVETVIMNKRRGTSVYGLGGMRETYSHRRPLLNILKSEIYEYAHENKIEWREDYTNLDTSFLRNSIRARLTESRIKLLLDYSIKKQEEHLELLNRAYELYGYPSISSNCISFKVPVERDLWSVLLHYHVKNLVSLNKKHYELFFSSHPSTRIVMLGNGTRLEKLSTEYKFIY